MTRNTVSNKPEAEKTWPGSDPLKTQYSSFSAASRAA